jgi:hypothetical protein
MKSLVLLFTAALIAVSPLPLLAQNLNGANLTLSGSITQNGTGTNFFNGNSNTFNGRACIGPSCDGTEPFEQGPLRLKWSEPDILFEDSSSTAGISSNDWRLVVNDSSTTRFSVQDIDGGTIPFTIAGGVPDNAFWLASSGRLGLGTSLPDEELHIVTGSSVASIALEETLNTDGGVRFNASNTLFSVQSLNHGTSPIYILHDAPTGSFRMQSNGDIGLGTTAPSSALHVLRSDGSAKILVEETGGGGAQELFQMKSNGGSYFTLSNTTSGRDWFFTHENNVGGRFIITSSTNPSQGLFFEPDGDMTIGGTLTENSDKHAKMAIEPVDTAEILDKVAALPVSSWSYKDDSSGARHLGPMAQDFHAAFGLGASETGIATLDTSGVALASIKALHDENERLKDQLTQQAALTARVLQLNAELTTRVEALEVQ